MRVLDLRKHATGSQNEWRGIAATGLLDKARSDYPGLSGNPRKLVVSPSLIRARRKSNLAEKLAVLHSGRARVCRAGGAGSLLILRRFG
jgi:hypothetical protein